MDVKFSRYDDILFRQTNKTSEAIDSRDQNLITEDLIQQQQISLADWQETLTLLISDNTPTKIEKHPGSRFYYYQPDGDPALFQLFINGREINLGLVDHALIQSTISLCEKSHMAPSELSAWLAQEETVLVLSLLFETEQLYFVDKE